MKTRKKTAEADEETSNHGGFREGAGRKATHGTTMKSGIYLRCSDEQKEALAAYVEGLSQARVSKGLPKVDLSTWLRELALKHSGNEHLGLAAHARAQAEAAASIV